MIKETKSLRRCNPKDVQYVNFSCSDSVFLCLNYLNLTFNHELLKAWRRHMKVRQQFFVAFFLLFSSIWALGQTPKQELNDKFWEPVRRGDLAATTALLDQGADVNAKFRYG